MKRCLLVISIALVLLSYVSLIDQQRTPGRPVNIRASTQINSSCTGEGAFYKGWHPNFLKELAGATDSEVHNRLNSVFDQLFFGDADHRIYQEVHYDDIGDAAYIWDPD